MKFKTVTHYVENSFEGKPSFIVVLEDLNTGEEKSYISNGCVFVENTLENVETLLYEYDCFYDLDELFNSEIDSLDVIRYGEHMLRNSNVTHFETDMPNLVMGRYMFARSEITHFTANMPNLVNTYRMFTNSNLTHFKADMPSLKYDRYMFDMSIKRRIT